MKFLQRSKVIKDQRSVLNTDAFDKRRFKELFEMSDELQKVRAEGILPTMEPLLSDVWASLYKMKPRILIGEIDAVLKSNQTLIKRVMSDEQFENFRRFTRLDDLSAAICTVKFGGKINEWLDDSQQQDEELGMLLNAIREQFSGKQSEKVEKAESEPLQELERAALELDEKLQLTFETNGDRFLQALDEAREETIRIKECLISLMGGLSAGKGAADLKNIPLRNQLSLADKIATDPKMQQIAEWAGRFKQIAQNKQKLNYTAAMERRDVTLGNELERLLPMELALYTHPAVRNEFLRRYAEGEIMQYEQKKREQLGKGPIVICLDQSGSMKLLDNQSKGFVLALLAIAKKQRRDLCVVLFSTSIQSFTYEKGKITAPELIRLVRTYLGGGTDFKLPLNETLKVINKSRFKQADVIFITDGEDELSEAFLNEFNQKKREKKFNVLSLVIGNHTDVTEYFSDKVLHVTNFDEEGSFAAFEI